MLFAQPLILGAMSIFVSLRCLRDSRRVNEMDVEGSFSRPSANEPAPLHDRVIFRRQ